MRTQTEKYDSSIIKGAKELVEICVAKGMKHVILSPGSRNAALSISFARNPQIKSLAIVDERSAAYFALGIAQQTRKPVGLVCTSGTALLNYGPAVAEAYYQRLPLVIISADRQAEWIGQDDGQTIPQIGLFSEMLKASYQLPLDANNLEECKHLNRMTNEALSKSQSGRMGPVHLNFPFREAFYELRKYLKTNKRIIRKISPGDQICQTEIQLLAKRFNQSEKILILAGLLHPQPELNELLNKLSKNPNVIVLTESVSNLHGTNFLPCIDRVICALQEHELKDFQPDLLISFGGPLISKMMKNFLRKTTIEEHWFIGIEENFIDTFQKLSSHINITPKAFFFQLLPFVCHTQSEYSNLWKKRNLKVENIHHSYLKHVQWSDLKAFEVILKSLPKKGNLQLANSSVVRYAQLFNATKQITCNSNRGTSGIDGCTSTAAGAAFVNKTTTTFITGDIGFFYDSNALWNKHLQGNLKIILINNQGGGIFRLITGPSKIDELEEYFETVQKYRANKLAQAYDLNYFYAENEEETKQILPEFYAKNNKASILEIKTPRKTNDKVLMNYFKTIKNKINDSELD